MPTSWYFPTVPILDRVARLQPTSVLDVGIGLGKWGFLLREMLDFSQARFQRQDWKTRIDGCDVHRYDSPIHDWVYDAITWGNVLEEKDMASGYDLVLLVDVIEHIDKNDGVEILRHLVATNKNVIVSTPVEFFTQHIDENPHEDHVSHWERRDFSGYVYDYEITRGPAMVVTIAGRDAAWPTRAEMRASELVYGRRWLNEQVMVGGIAKRLALRLVR